MQSYQFWVFGNSCSQGRASNSTLKYCLIAEWINLFIHTYAQAPKECQNFHAKILHAHYTEALLAWRQLWSFSICEVELFMRNIFFGQSWKTFEGCMIFAWFLAGKKKSLETRNEIFRFLPQLNKHWIEFVFK